MKRPLLTSAFAAALAVCLGGCIQRTVTINSDPEGALVHLNDIEVGRTPVTVPFTFYGNYDVRLERDGYQTLSTSHEAAAPWWENPGPDLVAEALPGNHDVHLQWHFDLKPNQPVDESHLVDHAKQLRATFEQGKNPAPATP